VTGFMGRWKQGLVLGVGLLMAGCAANGSVVNLDLQAVKVEKAGEGLSVAVAAFEDARGEKGRLGVRRHLWDGETTFNVPGGKAGDMVAKVAADYLKRKGWRTEGAPDVMLSGKVLDFSVNAQSKFGSTEITVKTKVAVEAVNKADGSVVRMTLNGGGSQKVFWFEPEDVQELASEVLSESFDKLVMNTKVENKLLRLK